MANRLASECCKCVLMPLPLSLLMNTVHRKFFSPFEHAFIAGEKWFEVSSGRCSCANVFSWTIEMFQCINEESMRDVACQAMNLSFIIGHWRQINNKLLKYNTKSWLITVAHNDDNDDTIQSCRIQSSSFLFIEWVLLVWWKIFEKIYDQ